MTRKISILDNEERRAIFGDFGYKEIGGGRIQIDASWVRSSIIACRLARANGKGEDVETHCHRKVKEPLEAAFAEVAERGLWRLIHSFDGLWVPRHKTWNPRRDLSSHSWGIAFDLNAATNPYGGGVSIENRTLNEVFNRFGFSWGGDWRGDKDGMHWEMADVDAARRNQAQSVGPRLIIALRHGPTFSYHALSGAQAHEGSFRVASTEVQQLLGLAQEGDQSGQELLKRSSKEPLEKVLQSLRLKVLRRGDHQSDTHDPRLYVFVETARGSVQSQQESRQGVGQR